jgi:hypothetical protein
MFFMFIVARFSMTNPVIKDVVSVIASAGTNSKNPAKTPHPRR